jgi:hypothetical protein
MCDCSSKIFTSGDVGRDQDWSRHPAVNEIENVEHSLGLAARFCAMETWRGRIICPLVEPCNALTRPILKSRGLELRRFLVPMSAKSFGWN